MSKYSIILFIAVLITLNSQVFAGDTTRIETNDFTLEVQKTYVDVKPFFNTKTAMNHQVMSFHFRGTVMDIIERWILAMEMEPIEFKIDGSRYKYRLRNFEDSTLIFNQVFEIVMTSKENTAVTLDYKLIQRAAFEAFIDLTEIELKKEKEEKTFWELRLIEENTISLSNDQNQFWKRSALEDYIYYERIHIGRIADLLGRKLDSFVRPIPNYSPKYDIKMPYSDDFFDLKYAMIEHGFELSETTQEIEVWTIKI